MNCWHCNRKIGKQEGYTILESIIVNNEVILCTGCRSKLLKTPKAGGKYGANRRTKEMA